MNKICLILLVFLIPFCANAQTSDDFKKMDRAAAFKGLAFQTTESDFLKKFSAKKIDSINSGTFTSYKIDNTQFLTIDSIRFASGKINFLNGKLNEFVLSADAKSKTEKDVFIQYLTKKLGKPTCHQNTCLWEGLFIICAFDYEPAAKKVFFTIRQASE